jgi:hypothetical protein
MQLACSYLRPKLLQPQLRLCPGVVLQDAQQRWQEEAAWEGDRQPNT